MTPAQNATIKADILASADMNTLPANSDGSDSIAKLYNLPASPAFSVWRTDASVTDITDAIEGSKYTPVDAPDATALQTNRLLFIQTKQINLATLLQGRTNIDASKVKVRSWLRDAVIELPAGTLGAMVVSGGASGVNVLNACIRNATRLEKLLSSAPVATGTVSAGVMGFEGSVSYQEIEFARK